MTTKAAIPLDATSEEAVRETAQAQTFSRPARSLWKDAWHRLLRNKAAVLGALVVVFFLAVAARRPILAPHVH